MKKIVAIMAAAACAMLALCLAGCGSSNSGVQLSQHFLDTFPFDGSLNDACVWLDDNGYEYSVDGDITTIGSGIDASNFDGWDFGASSIPANDGVMSVQLHKWGSVSECQSIYEECYAELKGMYGEPARSGDDYAWYTDGELVVGLLNFDDTIQVNIGIYETHSRYL